MPKFEFGMRNMFDRNIYYTGTTISSPTKEAAIRQYMEWNPTTDRKMLVVNMV